MTHLIRKKTIFCLSPKGGGRQMRSLLKIPVVILVLLWLIPSQCSGQTFSIIRDIDGSTDWGMNIQVVGMDSILVTGDYVVRDLSKFNFFSFLLDGNGTLIDSTFLSSDSFSYSFQAISEYSPSSKELYASILKKEVDSNYQNFPFVIKLNKVGKILSSSTFPDSLKGNFLGITTRADKSHFLTGFFGDSTGQIANLACAKMDSNLQLNEVKTLFDTSEYDVGFSIHRTINKNQFLIGSRSMSLANQPQIPSNATDPVLVIVDSNCNFVSHKSYGTPGIDGDLKIGDAFNGSYYAHADVDTMVSSNPINSFPNQNFVAKLSSQGDLVWRYFVESQDGIGRDVWNISLSKDKSKVLVVGNYRYRNSFIMAIDTTGNFLWERKYSPSPAQIWTNYLTDVTVDQNNFIWVVGVGLDTSKIVPPSGDLWVMKLDSMGCLNPGCGYTSLAPQPGDRNCDFVLSPNPSLGDFMVRFSHQPGPDSYLQIFRSDGILVQEIEVQSGTWDVPLSVVESGLYYVRYFSAQESITKKVLVVR